MLVFDELGFASHQSKILSMSCRRFNYITCKLTLLNSDLFFTAVEKKGVLVAIIKSQL